MVDVSLRHRRGTRSRPVSHWRLPMVIAGVAFAVLLVAGGAIHFAIEAYRDRVTLTGLSDDPTPVTIAIAGEVLSIPANMIRYGEARRGGAMQRVDLILHWPTLTGYSEDASDDFSEALPSPMVLFATVGRRDTALDATERLDAVYARFFTGKAVPGPAGLVGRTLDPKSGYGGEVVFFPPATARPFVARCLADENAGVAGACLRDVNFGNGLTLLYRFSRERLADWAALDAGMQRLAGSLLAR